MIPFQNQYPAALCASFSLFVLCLIAVPIQAQESNGSKIGGFAPVVPVFPRLAPRPGEGQGEDQRWRIKRHPKENAPTASFVDSLKGNDSAFHVVIGQGRLLTTKGPIATEEGAAVIAVGDPSVMDFDVLPNPRMIRITGRRAGVTDLSIATTDGEVYSFEVHVGYDLQLLRAQLQQIFPDANISLRQLREHLIVEGQARSPAQVKKILQSIESYLASVQVPQSSSGGSSRLGPRATGSRTGDRASQPGPNGGQQGVVVAEEGDRPAGGGVIVPPQIINLIRVPGVQQVMLKVQIAELNRTALREIGTDIFIDAAPDVQIGTQISNAVSSLMGLDVGAATTAFGIFSAGDFQIFFRALRRNGLLSVLAEPNLVTLSGHEASFLSGGQFPVPVAQGSSGGTTVTVQYKDFGTQLSFLPIVLDDEVIRLTVAPEVSTIDDSLGVTLTPDGEPVPGVNTRKSRTTVEMRAGQTLAIAGLLQVATDAQTDRIPGLGDLPYLGPLFGNTIHQRSEKELLVLITPHLVSASHFQKAPPVPGEEVMEPNDYELYFMNRIEGRTGVPFRSTTSWDRLQKRLYRMEVDNVYGPAGFSELP